MAPLPTNTDKPLSEEHYRALIDNQGEGIGIVDENEVFTFANPAAEHLFGVESGALVGRHLSQLLPPDQFDLILSQTEVRRAGKQSSYEFEITAPDGQKRVLLLTAVPRFGAEGEYRGAFGVFRDQTEQKRAERALRESEERYRLLIELLPHGVGILGSNKVLFANRALLQMFGHDSLADGLAQDPLAHFTESERERGLALVADLFAERITGPIKYQTSALRTDGVEIPLETYISLIPYQESKALQVFVIDISDRLRAQVEQARLEEQLLKAQKLESLGRLAGGIAHDFNNLLSPIVGYSELALMDLLPEDPLEENLRQIREAAERATSLVQQLLAFGRKQLLQTRILNLNHIISDSHAMLRRLIREDIQIRLELAPDLGSIRADSSQIQQILMNLTLNARDAMPHGGNMTIRTANVVLHPEATQADPEEQPGPHVMLEVEDEGRGMPDEVLSHLFEPFFSTKQKGHGTGLGLATVHGIVKQHGGHIRVISRADRGTAFKMFLPMSNEAAESLQRFQLQKTNTPLNGTILLAEDDDLVRAEARKILERHGLDVIEARDGYEAMMLAKYHKGPIHLLLTDVIMPGMNGRILFERLSGIRPEIKVLYMSGYTEDITSGQGILGDGHPFIHKPFTVQGLIEKIHQELAG